jgi:hypothetical protein
MRSTWAPLVLCGLLAACCHSGTAAGGRVGASSTPTASTPADGAVPIAPSPQIFWQRLVVINDTNLPVRVSCGRCRLTALAPGQRHTFNVDEDVPVRFELNGNSRCEWVGPRTGGTPQASPLSEFDEHGTQTIRVSQAPTCG